MPGSIPNPVQLIRRQSGLILDWIAEHSHQITSIPLRILRSSLVIALPFLIGAFGEVLVVSLISADYSLAEIMAHYRTEVVLTSLLLSLYFVTFYWHKRATHIYQHADRVHDALAWMYQDLNLGSDKDADIRCTIWIPTGRKNSHRPELQQIVDYYPAKSVVEPQGVFRSNKKAGRTRRIVRHLFQNDELTEAPVGVIGYCAYNAMHLLDPTTQNPEYVIETIPHEIETREQFVQYQVDNWNYTVRQAQRLTPDRRMYICFPMTNQAESELIGILHFDARKADSSLILKEIAANPKNPRQETDQTNVESSLEDGVSERLFPNVELYLPRFAQLLTKVKNS